MQRQAMKQQLMQQCLRQQRGLLARQTAQYKQQTRHASVERRLEAVRHARREMGAERARAVHEVGRDREREQLRQVGEAQRAECEKLAGDRQAKVIAERERQEREQEGRRKREQQQLAALREMEGRLAAAAAKEAADAAAAEVAREQRQRRADETKRRVVREKAELAKAKSAEDAKKVQRSYQQTIFEEEAKSLWGMEGRERGRQQAAARRQEQLDAVERQVGRSDGGVSGWVTDGQEG